MKNRNLNIKIVLNLFSLLFLFSTNQAYSQQSNSEQLSLSVGASIGYVPTLSFGEVDDSGAIVSLSDDLQYLNIIRQLDFVCVISETLSSESFSSGMGFFGSLGYKVVATDEIHIPIMLTDGASIIEYLAFDSYKDVSPQIGFTLVPITC